MSTVAVLQLELQAPSTLLPPPFDLQRPIYCEEKPPRAHPCTTDAKTKHPSIDADRAHGVIVNGPVSRSPITTQLSASITRCANTRALALKPASERGAATRRLLLHEDTQAPENTQTHEHALSVSVSTSESESPSVMRAEKQGVGGSGAANANAGAHSQSHAGDDGQGLGERAEGGEGIDIDDDGASDSRPPPHHA